MVERGAQGRPWFPGQLARWLATGRREDPPPLDIQLALALRLYEDALAHHGVRIGAMQVRKHLGWTLDVAAAAAGASAASVKAWRRAVLSAENPRETVRQLRSAFAALSWRLLAA